MYVKTCGCIRVSFLCIQVHNTSIGIMHQIKPSSSSPWYSLRSCLAGLRPQCSVAGGGAGARAKAAKPQIWAPSILQRNGSGSQWAPPAKLFLVSAFGRAPVGARAEAAFGALPKGALISGVVKA